jgi:hypothetical protein
MMNLRKTLTMITLLAVLSFYFSKTGWAVDPSYDAHIFSSLDNDIEWQHGDDVPRSSLKTPRTGLLIGRVPIIPWRLSITRDM